MKKRILSILISLVLCFSLGTSVLAAESVFDPSVTINRETEGKIIVTVKADDSILETKQPTLSVPCSYTAFAVTGPNGNRVSDAVTDGTNVTFTVAIGGTYTITELYDLWICGTQVTGANASNVLGDGTVSYDAETSTLTLTDAALEWDYDTASLIHCGTGIERLTIKGVDTDAGGNNSICYIGSSGSTINAPSTNLTFEGAIGDITGGGMYVVFGKSITVAKDCKIGSIGGDGTAIYGDDFVAIAGNMGDVQGGSRGIMSAGDIIISGTTGTITGTNYNGIHAKGDLTISGTVGKVLGKAYGLYTDGLLDISAPIEVTANVAIAAGGGIGTSYVAVKEPVGYVVDSVEVSEEKYYTTVGTADDAANFTPAETVIYAIGYEIEIDDDITGGSVLTDDNIAAEGAAVNVYVSPDDGMCVDQIVVKDESGAEIPVTNIDDGTYTYVQPAGKVTIEVTFKTAMYLVTWSNGNGGEYVKFYTYGETITVPDGAYFEETMLKSGYNLIGWTNEEGYQVGDEMPAQALTFTAVYEKQYVPTYTPTVTPSTPSTSTEVTKNEDGSTTTTVTDNKTGTVTETTENMDGSTTIVETQKDGTVTETVEDTDGSCVTTETKTETTVKDDGSTETVTKSTTTATDANGNVTTSTTAVIEVTKTKEDGTTETKTTITTETELADGTTATAVTDESGKTEAEVVISEKAAAAEEPVALPIPAVTASTDSEAASTVTVTTNSETDTAVVIPVAEGTGAGTVAVMVNADGTETVITESVVTENGLEVSVPDGATIKVVDNSTDFADVADTDWEKDAVDFTSARGIMNGTSAGENATFDPDAPTTRAMVWTMLARLSGVDTTPAEGESWWTVGQKWAMENGISDGTMHDGEITREQLATMLYRFVGSPETDHDITHFDDHHETSDWALDAKRWAVEHGIISGVGQADGSVTLEPKGNAIRSHVAQMFMNFMTKIDD